MKPGKYKPKLLSASYEAGQVRVAVAFSGLKREPIEWVYLDDSELARLLRDIGSALLALANEKARKR